MTGFELETFVPADHGRSALQLGTKELKSLRDAAYADGYKAGVTAANAGLAAEQNRILSALCELLADQRFDFEQANARVQASACEMVAALAKAMVPAVSAQHFDDIVLAHVQETTRSALDGNLVIRVSPRAKERLEDVLTARNARATLVADEALSDMQAKLEWAAGADEIDLDTFSADLDRAVGEYVSKVRGLSDERPRNTG